MKNTTAPATARLSWSSTVARNDGANELKSPRRVKAENPANDAARNSPWPCVGMPRPLNRYVSRLLGSTVSGETRRKTAATTSKPRYTSNTKTVGFGPYSAKSPATSGPRPSPPMLAPVDASEARRPDVGPARSVNAAVAVPVINPAARPERTRPTNRKLKPGARMNTTVLAVLKARAIQRTGRRPTWSDDRPAKRSETITPAA